MLVFLASLWCYRLATLKHFFTHFLSILPLNTPRHQRQTFGFPVFSRARIGSILSTFLFAEVFKSSFSYFFNAWCPQKGHAYLNKPAAKSCKFVSVCMAFLWTQSVKKLKLLKNAEKTNRGGAFTVKFLVISTK